MNQFIHTYFTDNRISHISYIQVTKVFKNLSLSFRFDNCIILHDYLILVQCLRAENIEFFFLYGNNILKPYLRNNTNSTLHILY